MDIALISPVFPYPQGGVYVGIERHVLELARHLRQADCSVTIFTTFWNGGRDGDRFENMTIFRASDLSQDFGRFAALLDLHYVTWGRNLLMHRKRLSHCDVVHALAPLSSSRALTSMGLPLVTHFHHYEAISQPRDLLFKPFHHRIEGRAYRNSTLVATLSNHSARNLQNAFHIPRGKIRIIPDGVDINRFAPSSKRRSETPILLCVGEHVKRKGLDYLWRALALLQEREFDFRLVSVGTGPETDRLRSLARELEIDSRIRFVGYVDPLSEELPQIYRDADVLVHPSLEEGFGMVLAEAMASGVPVIAINSGAIPEVVGDDGILVPPHDHVSIADAIETILTDTTLAKSLGCRGRSRVKSSFSWTSVTQRTLRVYEEAIEKAARLNSTRERR